jgi:iron-sulfur cluster assembly protein
VITLTKAALGECRRLLPETDDGTLGVRIGLRPGGCAGTRYVVDCPAPEGPTDHVFEQGGVRVYCDTASLPSLDGLQIDFVLALMGGGFRFENPQAVNRCACGDSFATE